MENCHRYVIFFIKINVMPKTKGPKLFAPRKVKGGNVLGKDDEVWYAVRAKGFSTSDNRDFKRYFGECCKEFFAEDEVVPPEDKQEEIKSV
jgi:hypothetical protein